MENICQNCTLTIQENFCSNCGQKKFKRIDRKYIWDEVQYSLIHTNKGFLYSAKKIIKNPGKTAREFIYGNRVNHYKPILLVFLLSGISAFISFKVIGFDKIIKSYYASQHLNSKFMNDMLSFIASYNSFMMLILVPIFALFTKIALRKWGQNYYEHIIMNAYLLSFYTLLSIIILSPILYLLRNNVNAAMLISNSLILLGPVLQVWFYKGFYPEKSLKSIIVKVLLIIGLIILAYVTLIMLVSILAIVLAMFMGPEFLKYFKPQ
ncbi:DUF3667 domain-containing protein [Pedobacter frigiditerrae]|uniref:DUF3667 domain-containing protein n=1 Tax=Pedobacter frigiditerrae TaxID=2530452 RepID=A0A4R0MK86_9SPHI|nr:DUF3667 domain-containing protein [Pedobacter frigiditerrae]TCC86991.1 DUF3667 domain-containing protein [Pedobacter frigiditerrae]